METSSDPGDPTLVEDSTNPGVLFVLFQFMFVLSTFHSSTNVLGLCSQGVLSDPSSSFPALDGLGFFEVEKQWQNIMANLRWKIKCRGINRDLLCPLLKPSGT